MTHQYWAIKHSFIFYTKTWKILDSIEFYLLCVPFISLKYFKYLNFDFAENTSASDWPLLQSSLHASEQVVAGLITFIGQHSNNRRGGGSNNNMVSNGINSQYGGERSGSAQESASFVGANLHHNSRYKTSMCRDLTLHGSCPRGKNCSFAHSPVEMDQ